MAPASAAPHPTLFIMLRRVWEQLKPLMDPKARRFARVRYRVSEAGALEATQLEETFQIADGESPERFMVRAWSAYKLSAGDHIEFSIQSGRLTARVVQHVGDPSPAEIHATLAALSAQLARYADHLEQGAG